MFGKSFPFGATLLLIMIMMMMAMVMLSQEAAAVPSLQRREQQSPSASLSLSLAECAAKQGECDDSVGPVCGTDDQTYPTRCHLLRVQCSGHQVSFKHSGNCKGCLAARQYALRERQRNPKIFFPRCRGDGNYAAVQCLTDTGCWCSDSGGNPIKNTSTRRGRPKCQRFYRRRAPIRQASSPEADASGPGHRVCSRTDRAAFNSQLMGLFRGEFERSRQLAGASDASVLDWKFTQLDRNGNQLLDRPEVRELKKIVKRAVKPRRCGRALGKYCDVSRDDNLSRLEWSNCLTKDASQRKSAVNTAPHRSHFTNLPIRPSDTHNTNTIGSSIDGTSGHSHEFMGNESGEEEVEADADYTDEDDSMTQTLTSSFTFLNPTKSDTPNNESEGDTNCWTDRELAREEQRHVGNSSFFVPECTADGRYKRVQCYSSICWCVNEETGKNIPGTFSKKRPQCDEAAVVRAMKGCTGARKIQFLKELKEFLNTKILPNTANTANLTLWKSEDERIATLSFVFLDKNKSKSWERKEWKIFRDLVTSASNLRKCGKKMPRYCDVNGDKKISLSEWVNCLQSQRAETTTTSKPPQYNETVTSRLLGSNPLETYLKD